MIRFREIIETPISNSYNRDTKLKLILEVGTKEFNRLVFSYLKTTDYPLSFEENYSLIENDDVIVLEDVYKILNDSGIGIPATATRGKILTISID